MLTLKEFLLINENASWKQLLAQDDNEHYREFEDVKYALVNLTTKDIYEVNDKKEQLSLAGFEGEFSKGDEVVIYDTRKNKAIERLN